MSRSIAFFAFGILEYLDLNLDFACVDGRRDKKGSG
jgi:hypothetical protein